MKQQELAEAVYVTPQAISMWENGKRFPDAEAQIMLFKVLDLNPAELLTGFEMFDEDLKHGIAAYIRRIDEKVFASGMMEDEDGNELYVDLSEYLVLVGGKDENSPDKWIPYNDYYNVEPTPKYEDPYVLPEREYDPEKIYINHFNCTFVIPVEILETMGKPKFFNLIRNTEHGWVGFLFTDEMREDGFDIPEKVYNGKWKGIHVDGGSFGRQLCKEMGVRYYLDLIEIEPVLLPERKMIMLPLDRAKRVNVNLDYSSYLLPQWQYDALWEDDEEEWEEE